MIWRIYLIVALTPMAVGIVFAAYVMVTNPDHAMPVVLAVQGSTAWALLIRALFKPRAASADTPSPHTSSPSPPPEDR